MYRGFDNDQGCEVAWNRLSLKNLPTAEQEHITKEVKLNRNLNHPNIVHFISAWTNSVKEELIIITEIVTGGSLKQYLKKIKHPRLKVIKMWCRGILEGLDYLHSQKPYPIIHRDLKCANVFIMSNTGDIKIGDFGLSTLMEEKMQTSVLGTPEYMAPEIYKGCYDKKIDIYSFGMCVIEMCTLASPYSECRTQAAIYKKVISGEPPAALSQIDNADVVNFIKKCLLPAELRPSTVELLADEFLVINEEDDRIHHPLVVNSSPKSNQSSSVNSFSHIDISLIINENGESRQISFQYVPEADTPEKVAEEMVEDLKLNKSYIIPVAKEIETRLNSLNSEKKLPNLPRSPVNFSQPQFSPNNYLSVDYMNEGNFPNMYDETSEVFADSMQLKMKTVRSENDIGLLIEAQAFIPLKKGLENDKPRVKKVQLSLSSFLNVPLKIDGFFGKKVEALVKKFQELQGMKPDGIVAKVVWDALLSIPSQN